MTDLELLENNGTCYVWLLKNETHLKFREKKRGGAVRKSGIQGVPKVRSSNFMRYNF